MTIEQQETSWRFERKPYKLDEAVIQMLEGLVAKGLPLALCASYADVSPMTFHRWLRLGQEPDAETKNPLQHKLYKAISKSRASAALKRIQNIQEISERESSNSWQASAWLLERTYPEHFGKRPDVEVTVNNNNPIPQAISSQSTEELEALLASLNPADDNESYGFQALPSGDS